MKNNKLNINGNTPPLRVLVADDVQATRHTTCLMLKIIPNVNIVAVAENGRQAVKLAQEQSPNLAILDINMPGLNGLETLQLLRKLDPTIKCIIISSERQKLTMDLARDAGAIDYLVKPFTSEELTGAIEQAARLLQMQSSQQNGTTQSQDHRNNHLIQLATEYAKERRKDDKAVKVLEELASSPNCDVRWLKSLAMLYVYQTQWRKLKLLAEHLEKNH